MKETIKIALLAIIAVTLIVNTMGQRGMIGGGTTEDSTESMSSAVATPSKAASIAEAEKAFDPLAKEAEPVDLGPKTTVKFASYDHDFGNGVIGTVE